MADRAEELHVELAGLLAQHGPTLTERERDDLVLLEEGYGWRPGRRPARPEPKIAAFLDLFDRAEQEELDLRHARGRDGRGAPERVPAGPRSPRPRLTATRTLVEQPC